jgi:hypothetical protein
MEGNARRTKVAVDAGERNQIQQTARISVHI